jgi:hypothetical protein
MLRYDAGCVPTSRREYLSPASRARRRAAPNSSAMARSVPGGRTRPLARQPRADRGKRRLPAALQSLIKGMALRRPAPTAASIPAGVPVRPRLTAIEDDHSRALLGWALNVGAPSALQTALAFRKAIWRKSVPSPGWPPLLGDGPLDGGVLSVQSCTTATQTPGRGLSVDQVKYVIERLYFRDGLRARVPAGALVHALRHTFATSGSPE